MAHPHLLVEHSPAGYTWLRLSRPKRRNALDADLARALRDELAADPARTMLLGSGENGVFCAGADLTVSAAERAVVSDLIYACCEIIITRPGPVIAVVTGAAVGGGALLAAAADLRIAAPAARLRWTGPPEVDLVVGAWLLPSLVWRGVAMDLVLTGRWVSSTEALALGLVSRLVEEPEPIAEEIAAELRPGPAVKQVMAGDLLQRLNAERQANRAAWAEHGVSW
jgi:enoyl-CoA hydratase/carnithine racemase